MNVDMFGTTICMNGIEPAASEPGLFQHKDMSIVKSGSYGCDY